MASVENSNRFSAIELDDDGNIVKQKAPKKQEKEKKEEEVKPQVQAEPKDRTRVSDRNRRGGRGGGSVSENGAPVPSGDYVPRGGAGGRGRGRPHRGGYIGDGEKREFDRRGAPNNDRPRGRARKGGVGLGRYDGEENNRRNRPSRSEVDPTVEPTSPDSNTDAVDATSPVDATVTEETPVVVDATPVVEAEPVPEEEIDTSLTLEQFQAQQKNRIVDSDINRELRKVEINDKQWSKISKALDGGKKKFKLNARGEEVVVEEEERTVVEKRTAKKTVLSLDEFVGTSPAPQVSSSSSSESSYSRGGRGGASSEFRGRGRGRGGASGEFRGRGRGRGGRGGGSSRGPSVAIDDKNAFPDLSAAAKKN